MPVLLFSVQLFAQLGFCEGSKGDPIFHEEFNQDSPLPGSVTNYTWVTGDPEDGEYTISDRIGADIGGWHSYLPDSPDSGGKALIVNADFSSGRFYRAEISGLCQNTTYEFSAFLMNIYNRASGVCEAGGIPVNVRFEIWDETDSVLLKEGSTGNIPSTTSPHWERFGLTFQSGAGQGSVILKMYNNGDGGCGNDLAIDDIIFRSCGDLTTLTHEGEESYEMQICPETDPVDLELTASPDNSVYTTHFFQWQLSRDGQTWEDLQGETAATLAVTGLKEQTYFRVKVAEDAQNLQDNLCSSASEAFLVNIPERPAAPQSLGDREICSEDPVPQLEVQAGNDEQVNWFDAPTGGNLLAGSSLSYTPDGEGTFYAEAVKSGADCAPGPRTAVSLIIHPTPTSAREVVTLCKGQVAVLQAKTPNMEYRWSTGETSRAIEVEVAGSYSVEVISPAGCTALEIYEVEGVETPEIREVLSEDRQVSIIPQTEGDFEYSLDGENFSSSPVFPNRDGGIYTAYMRDLNVCTTVTHRFVHLVIPAFITPNRDGHNDHFEIKGLSFFGFSEIRLFDRYGKMLARGPGADFKWDGTLSGKALPADDYWYEVQIEGFEPKRGHFSLVR